MFLNAAQAAASFVLFARVGFSAGLRTFAFFCSFWKVVLVLLKGWSTIADHQGLQKHPLSTHFPSYLQTLWGGMNFGYGFLNKMINASQSAQNIGCRKCHLQVRRKKKLYLIFSGTTTVWNHLCKYAIYRYSLQCSKDTVLNHLSASAAVCRYIYCVAA